MKAFGELLLLPVDRVELDPDQPRKQLDERRLDELADSIRRVGVIMPIAVRQSGAKYIVVAGERRFRAAQVAGVKTIPGFITVGPNVDDVVNRRVLQIEENRHREDLSEHDMALAIDDLMREHGLTQRQVGERLGMSQSRVSSILVHLHPDKARELAACGGSASNRALFASLPVSAQQLLLERFENTGVAYTGQALKKVRATLASGAAVTASTLSAALSEKLTHTVPSGLARAEPMKVARAIHLPEQFDDEALDRLESAAGRIFDEAGFDSSAEVEVDSERMLAAMQTAEPTGITPAVTLPAGTHVSLRALKLLGASEHAIGGFETSAKRMVAGLFDFEVQPTVVLTQAATVSPDIARRWLRRLHGDIGVSDFDLPAAVLRALKSPG